MHPLFHSSIKKMARDILAGQAETSRLRFGFLQCRLLREKTVFVQQTDDITEAHTFHLRRPGKYSTVPWYVSGEWPTLERGKKFLRSTLVQDPPPYGNKSECKPIQAVRPNNASKMHRFSELKTPGLTIGPRLSWICKPSRF
jgi:hypothetical protein